MFDVSTLLTTREEAWCMVTGHKPTGHFAYLTVRLLFGHFACWTPY